MFLKKLTSESLFMFIESSIVLLYVPNYNRIGSIPRKRTHALVNSAVFPETLIFLYFFSTELHRQTLILILAAIPPTLQLT